jgi:outer membrane immunogenic protein
MLKKTLIASCSALALIWAVPAKAADVIAVDESVWQGLYAGSTLGYNYTSTHVDTNHEGENDIDLEAGSVAVHAGYNHVMGGFLIGVELDGSIVESAGGVDASDETDSLHRIDLDPSYVVSARARVGLPFDNLLVYATGGMAWTSGDWASTSPGGTHGVGSFDTSAFVYGGGIEYMALEDVSLRVEVLHQAWDESTDFEENGSDPWTADLKGNTSIRLGASFHF